MKTAVFCGFMLYIVATFTAAKQERVPPLSAIGICIRLHSVTLHIPPAWVLLPPPTFLPQTDRPSTTNGNIFVH